VISEVVGAGLLMTGSVPKDQNHQNKSLVESEAVREKAKEATHKNQLTILHA
jgi:hypothetical protein